MHQSIVAQWSSGLGGAGSRISRQTMYRTLTKEYKSHFAVDSYMFRQFLANLLADSLLREGRFLLSQAMMVHAHIRVNSFLALLTQRNISTTTS